jgi:hypothetical protein
MEFWWNESGTGKLEYSKKSLPYAILSATNRIWTDLMSNPEQ